MKGKGRYKKVSLKDDKYNELICVRISPYRCTPKEIIYRLQHKIETSFCTYLKGSLTVEAAVVVPLTMGCLLAMLFFFRILFVQSAVEEALIYTGRILAIESCLIESEEALYASAEVLLKYKLSQNEDIKRFVTGGIAGVTLVGSQLSGKEIELIANYMVEFPIDFFGKKGFWLTSNNSFVKWKGNVYTDDVGEGWVYITETGSVYHKDTECRSLNLSIQKAMLKDVATYRGENGQMYSPCTRCMKSSQESTIIYITDYGYLYHEDLYCSALKRTISRILLSEVGNRRACSFCY